MAPREVDVARARLTALVRAATRLSAQLEDLHVVAYDRAVRSDVKVSGGSAGDLETVGDRRARLVWKRIERDIRAAETTIVAVERLVGNVLTAGPGVEESRGSLLSKREFHAALRQQHERRQRGEYTPEATMEQPPYPGSASA